MTKVDNGHVAENFADLSTPLIADAALRLKISKSNFLESAQTKRRES